MHRFGKAFGLAAIIATFALMLASPAWAGVLYNQPFCNCGNLYASQNDTNGNGNFATVYDNFTLGTGATINNVEFTGGYFNPPNQGPIAGWTIQFWSNNGGQPGTSLFSQHISGTGNETFLGNFNGFPVYTYSLDITGFAASAGTEYWMSVVPDLGFPPQWGWAAGTGGDGIAYQDFFGTRSQLNTDMAFTLNGGGGGGVPEPASLFLLGSGLLGLGRVIRRKK